ncbi:hypothetical protein [Nannocystis pusilla]|uniref:hypothetical protein n=1 Tax=Nannocystis pusilla TaxID=889268 RepID=UPI003DA27C7A
MRSSKGRRVARIEARRRRGRAGVPAQPQRRALAIEEEQRGPGDALGSAQGVHDDADHLVGVDEVDEAPAQAVEQGPQDGAVVEQPALEPTIELGAQRVDEHEHGEGGEQGVEDEQHRLAGEGPRDPQHQRGVHGGDRDDEQRHAGDPRQDLRQVEQTLARQRLGHEVQVDGGGDRADDGDARLAERERDEGGVEQVAQARAGGGALGGASGSPHPHDGEEQAADDVGRDADVDDDPPRLVGELREDQRDDLQHQQHAEQRPLQRVTPRRRTGRGEEAREEAVGHQRQQEAQGVGHPLRARQAGQAGEEAREVEQTQAEAEREEARELHPRAVAQVDADADRGGHGGGEQRAQTGVEVRPGHAAQMVAARPRGESVNRPARSGRRRRRGASRSRGSSFRPQRAGGPRRRGAPNAGGRARSPYS